MSSDHQRRTNLGVGIGFGMQLGGMFVSGQGDLGAIFGLLVILAGLIVFIWGCMNYAEGKGHNKWVGLVGVAGCIGLIVLIVLPDLAKDAASQLAGAARSEARGDIEGALSLYRSIQRQFPGSREALDADASIRAIEIKRGKTQSGKDGVSG